MGAARNKELARRWLDEAVNGRDLSVLDDIVAEGMINHEDVSGQSGREGFRRTLAMMVEMIPDHRMDATHIIADDEFVVIRLLWSGTPQGKFMKREVTGKSFSVTHHHTFRVENGLLAEHWANRDDLGMHRQLGTLALG